MAELARDLLKVREVARGGLGVVELALRREGRFERMYAIKRPHPHLLDSPKFVEMFLEEGRLAGLLRHPNVVPVLDVGTDDRGPFLLMDFVEGVSVVELVRAAQRDEELLPQSVVVQIARQAAEGLRAAHELVGVDGTRTPIVHRDVSPQNILVGYDGIVRVLDFGIAKALRADTPHSAAGLKGKYGYMAPEQFRFEGVDPRTDLFALGVVVSEALVAKRLYRGDADTAARLVLDGPPPDLRAMRPDVDPELERLLLDMLAKERAERVPNARAVIERLVKLEQRLRQGPDWIGLDAYMEWAFADRRAEERAGRARDFAEASRQDHTEPTVHPVRPEKAALTPRVIAFAAAGALALAALGFGLAAWSSSDAPSRDANDAAASSGPNDPSVGARDGTADEPTTQPVPQAQPPVGHGPAPSAVSATNDDTNDTTNDTTDDPANDATADPANDPTNDATDDPARRVNQAAEPGPSRPPRSTRPRAPTKRGLTDEFWD